MTPERGKIHYGLYRSPFGHCLIAATEKGVCNLHFLDNLDPIIAANFLHSKWKNADILLNQETIHRLGDRLFKHEPVEMSAFHLDVKGTEFQLQVWRALLNIPFGQTTTYQDLAITIGKPTSARAVGNAVGCNPVSYLIPCHRVIRKSGAMGGYRWGLDRKIAMLNWEKTGDRLSIKTVDKLKVAQNIASLISDDPFTN